MAILKGSYLSHTIILGIHVGFEECTPPNAGFLSPISFVPQLVASISYTFLEINSSHLKIGLLPRPSICRCYGCGYVSFREGNSPPLTKCCLENMFSSFCNMVQIFRWHSFIFRGHEYPFKISQPPQTFMPTNSFLIGKPWTTNLNIREAPQSFLKSSPRKC